MGTHVKVNNNVLVRDQNRYRKVYRYIRKKPYPLTCDDGTIVSDFTWGAYFVEFNNQHEVEHHFPCCYASAPAIIATTVSKHTSGWADSATGTSAEVTFRLVNTGPLTVLALANLKQEYIHLQNADGSVDEITLGGTKYAAGSTDHASRTVTRTLNVGLTSPSTKADAVDVIAAAINGDPNIQWEATDMGVVDSHETFKLTSKVGNKGPRANMANPDPSAGGDPQQTAGIVDSWGLCRARGASGNNAEIVFVPVATDGGGATGTSSTPINSNFNTFITDISASKCTFRTSGYFTGYVHYQALVDGVYTMPDIGRTMEVKTLSYDKTNTQSYTFTVNSGAGFTCTPIVTATADEDVNVFITSISKTAVTVEVSQANYEGNVYLQAIEKGC